MTKHDAMKLTKPCEPFKIVVLNTNVVRKGFTAKGEPIYFVGAKGFNGAKLYTTILFSI